MVFSRSFLAASLLTLAPTLAYAQDSAAALQSCLTTAGVRNIIESDTTWANETLQFQKRITPDPAAIAFPTTRDQIALSLDCARNASAKVSALGPAHSFVGYGFGTPGNLIINMGAFDELSFDTKTNQLKIGGGAHVGPALKYLWEGYGRHFPHVRGAHVGVVGSSIGGGFGSTSRWAGTPMDNLVAVEYMLWNGTIVNGGKGSELLWAAQGAGSSYGIILSVTTKTVKPPHERAVNFTLSIGDVDVDTASRAFVAIQDYAVSDNCPDEFALRWSLSAPPYSGTGYFYGDAATFDKVVAPLLEQLNDITNTTTLARTELSFWDMELQVTGAGLLLANGGSLGGRAFYTQALTTTADKPLTEELVKTLFESTTLAFNRTDLRKSGFFDLWGGVSRSIKDKDTSYAHGNNLWLIRWEANSPGAWPADGISYMKGLIKPFENALVEAEIPLRGFVNYRDEALTEPEWSARLYGSNYNKLKQLKKKYDPQGLFNNNAQAIPLP